MGSFRGVLIFLLITACFATGQKQTSPSLPQQFEIGRHTFFDFGPPTDFYEIFVVRMAESGVSIDRITLTPPSDMCTLQPKFEMASALIHKSAASLLGSISPCNIPEKELHRELKRCKKCLVFSGAKVSMRVACGSQARIIRSDILDRDMFDANANTPQHTSWTMQLLTKLDQAVGPGVMEEPIFQPPSDSTSQPPTTENEILGELAAGSFDTLFVGAPDKPSQLYRDAQKAPPVPTVKLIAAEPFKPEVYVEPNYPPIARLARIEGLVAFEADIDSRGKATNVMIEKGHPMLVGSVNETIENWRFPSSAVNQHIRGSIEFALHCVAKQK